MGAWVHRLWCGLFAAVLAVCCQSCAREKPRPHESSTRCHGACEPAAADRAFGPETLRLGLILGHNVGSGSRPPLRFAESDANRVAAVLRELGGFAAHHVHLLQAPTRIRVKNAMTAIEAQLAAWRSERKDGRVLLFVYYSGHADGRGLELASEQIRFKELKDWLTSTRAELRVIVLDACQSGSLVALKGGSSSPGFPLGERLMTTGEAILTSTTADEVALESSELRASFFSHHLVSALRGAADADRDGRVTLGEAYTFASGRTVAETAATVYGAQHPTYKLQLSGSGDVFLTELPKSGAKLELPQGLDRVLIIESRSGSVLAEVGPGSAGRIAVVPGPYLLRAWDGSRELSARLKVGLRETRRVELRDFVEMPAAANNAEKTPANPQTGAETARAPDRSFPGVSKPATPSSGTCSYRCLIDVRSQYSDCSAPIKVLTHTGLQSTWQIELPSRQSRVSLKFEVCNPRGLWLNIGDSPSCNGGGGDATQFSNDAEVEARAGSLWVFGNDYSRSAAVEAMRLASLPKFASVEGCTERSLEIADGRVTSPEPRLDLESEYALRLDPPEDHEGRPDRTWYLGVNRSIASAEPSRAGEGLTWLEVCLR